MSISDRLDEIEDDIHVAFRLPKDAPVAVVAEERAPDMLAALRAVLDVCDSTPEPYMPVRQAEIRAAIEAALGEGHGNA